MRAERIRSLTALALPPATWFVFQQGLGFTLRGACAAAGFPAGPVWGLSSICVCGMGALLAWPIARGRNTSNAFVARLALLAAGLFALAVAYQTLATMIVPPCAR